MLPQILNQIRQHAPKLKGDEKLAVITEIISPYRVPVFNQLAQSLGEKFKVFFMSDTCPGRQWEIPYSKIKFDYEVLKGFDLSRSNGRPNPTYLNPGVGLALKKFSPSFSVIGGYHHVTSYLVLKYAKLHSTRLFLWCESTLYDKHSNNPLVERLKRMFIRACDGYLVPGKASEDYLRFHGARDRFSYAPNSVDVEIFQDAINPNELIRQKERTEFRRRFGLPQFVVLFVGRLSPEKNIPTALRVMKRLQDRGVQVGLVLVGDGPYQKKYETLRDQLQVGNVVFIGFKQQEELPYYYLMSDVLILPSDSEPWGLVVNESLACGLPVLCSRKVGCASDLIVEGKTGYMCAQDIDYEERITQLYNKPEQIEFMQNHCREHIAKFTPEHCANGFLNLCHLRS